MNEKNITKTLRLWNKEYKKGLFSYIVLLLLKDKSMYGFEIAQTITNITENKMSFEESGIYHTLKKLTERKFLTTEWVASSKGPKRKYYTITESGKTLLKQFTEFYVIPINKVMNKLIKNNYEELIQ